MAIYKRGGVWWFEFSFQGQRIRESAHTTSKTIAKEAERQRPARTGNRRKPHSQTRAHAAVQVGSRAVVVHTERPGQEINCRLSPVSQKPLCPVRG